MNVFWQPGMSLEDSEKQIILYELRRLGGNKTKTAGSLGISIRTLDNKLEKYQEKKNGNGTGEGQTGTNEGSNQSSQNENEASTRNGNQPVEKPGTKRAVSVRERAQV